MIPRPTSLLFGILLGISVLVSGTEKSESFTFPEATLLFQTCLAPLKSVLNGAIFAKVDEPVCSAQEFSVFGGDELMKMDGSQINSIPPSYFESIKSNQVTRIETSFINQLGKEQAMAFSKDAVKALPVDSRKLLNKIKKRPGPVARGIILALSALTAFIIYKYS